MTAASARVVVGLDVGTTAAKAVAFGVGSGARRAASREYPLLQPAADQQVQDPDVVVAAALDSLAGCVAGRERGAVAAVSVSAAMHGLIGLDAAMRPVTPLVTWADSRARQEARALRASGQAGELHRTSGTPVHPMSPLTKLMWFARHEPATCARVHWWVGLKDYLLLRLTGTLVTELSSASATGLLDLRTRHWNPVALELAGVSCDRLPEILPPTSARGLSPEAAQVTGLPPGTPVVLGAADGPLGNVGTGAVAAGSAGLSLGTSGAVRVVVPQPPADLDGALFCYALTEQQWVVGAAISNGAHVVRWAGQALAGEPGSGPTSEESLLALAATVPPGSDGLVMLPYLLAERAPLWDPDLPGAYLGLQRHHGRAHLVRAAVEGVCLQLAAITDRLGRVAPVTTVRATGGAFRATLWRRSVSAALGRPLFVRGEAEGSALGAAALGLLATGDAEDLDAAVRLLDGTAHEEPVPPDPSDVAAFDTLRSRLPELIGALRPVAALFATAPAR